MKKSISLALLAFLLLFSSNAFCAIAGAPAACIGDYYWYADDGGSTTGTWSTSNSAIATIGASTGMLQGHTAGTVTISYTDGSSVSTMVVTITPHPAPIVGPSAVCPGSSATFSDAVAGGTWSSSNTAVATIDPSTGVMAGVATGTSIVMYSTGGCGSQVMVTVGPPPPDTATGPSGVCPGSSITLTTVATGGAWSSSNTAVATVGASSGVVNGILAGTATISYGVSTACGTGYSYRVITVSTTTDAGAISGMSTVPAGSYIVLTESISGGTWSSSDASKATVSASGFVSGVSAGTCTISYAVTGCSGVAYATKDINVGFPLSVGTITSAGPRITTYPNPASNELTVSWDVATTEQGYMVITDISGREISRQQITLKPGTGIHTIDMTAFTSGLYLVSIRTVSISYNTRISVQR